MTGLAATAVFTIVQIPTFMYGMTGNDSQRQRRVTVSPTANNQVPLEASSAEEMQPQLVIDRIKRVIVRDGDRSHGPRGLICVRPCKFHS
jgi:hypothetical protein